MTKNKPTAAEAVLKTLSGRKRGITIDDIAAKTGLKRTTAQRAVYDLTQNGSTKVVGQVYTGSKGRPPQLYSVA